MSDEHIFFRGVGIPPTSDDHGIFFMGDFDFLEGLGFILKDEIVTIVMSSAGIMVIESIESMQSMQRGKFNRQTYQP